MVWAGNLRYKGRYKGEKEAKGFGLTFPKAKSSVLEAREMFIRGDCEHSRSCLGQGSGQETLEIHETLKL